MLGHLLDGRREKCSPELPGHSGGRLPGRRTEEKGRAEEEECLKSKQGQKKSEKIKEGIRSSQSMALEGQNHIQRWDCSQIENEEEGESWQEGGQMAEQWREEQFFGRHLLNEEEWKEAL